jgi:hypothetical protein
VAAGFRAATRGIAAVLCWASAGFVVLRAWRYYFHIGGVQRHHVEAASLVFVFLLLAVALIDARRAPAVDVPPPRDPPLPATATAALFIAAALLLYWPVLSTGLFADDFVLLTAAQDGRFTVWRELFRPSLFVMWRAWSAVNAQPAALLHAANVVLHGLNAFLLYRAGSAAGLPRWAAISAGALFICYPAAIEPVAWPSGVQDVLMSTCVLSVVVLGITGEVSAGRLVLIGLALAVGLLTKETAIAAPFLLFALGFVRSMRRTAWPTAAACAAIVALFLAIRFSLLPLPATHASAPARYAIKELLVRPFATLVVPFRAAETAAHPALGVASVAVVVLLMAGAITARRDRMGRLPFVGASIVLAAVAPVLTFFYVDADLLGSRYLYLALTGWTVMLASLASSLSPRAPGVLPIVCLIAVWVPATRVHLGRWRDAAVLREHILAAAAAASDPRCPTWIVRGLPEAFDGVPLFVNGFPEAARSSLGGQIRVSPDQRVEGECQLTWTGEAFKRE